MRRAFLGVQCSFPTLDFSDAPGSFSDYNLHKIETDVSKQSAKR
jgi:hypothetical protein